MPASPAANAPAATPQTPTPMTPAAPRPPVAQAPLPPNPPRAPRNAPAVNILPVPVLARIPGRGRYWGGSGIEGDEPSVSFTSSAPSYEPPTDVIVPASAPASIALAPAADPSPEAEQPASPGSNLLAQNRDVAPTPSDIGSDATSPAVTVSRPTSTDMQAAPTVTAGAGMSDDAKCKLGAGLWTGSGLVLGKAALDAGSLLAGGLLGVAAAACFGIAAYLWSSRTPPRLPKVSIPQIDQAKNAVSAANQGHGQDQIRENQDCDDVRLGIKFGNQATSNAQLREMGIPTQPRSVPQDINQQ